MKLKIFIFHSRAACFAHALCGRFIFYFLSKIHIEFGVCVCVCERRTIERIKYSVGGECAHLMCEMNFTFTEFVPYR